MNLHVIQPVFRRKEFKNTYHLPTGEATRKVLVKFFGDQRKALLRWLKTEHKDLSQFGLDPVVLLECKLFPPHHFPHFDKLGLGTKDLVKRVLPTLLPLWQSSGTATMSRLRTLKARQRHKIHKKAIDTAFDVHNPAIAEAIELAAFKFCDKTNATTSLQLDDALQTLREALTENLEGGTTLSQLVDVVQSIFDTASTSRARRIAATEASRAQHQAQLIAAKESGVVTGMEWLASEDACFGAGSLVLGVRDDGKRVPISIETLVPGDLVVGGSGKPRRVLAVAKKPYLGPMVCGPGFTVTPDHKFLASDGWRPIGEYAVQARFRRILDFFIGKAKDVPSTFLQIFGLSPVFVGNSGFTVPVETITKDDQIEIIYHKINNPSVIHGDLLSKCDHVSSEEFRHQNFNIGSGLSDGVIVGVSTVFGAKVVSSSLRCMNPRRILSEGLSAILAKAWDSVFTCLIAISEHFFAMILASTFSRAKDLAPVLPSVPLGLKLDSTSRTFLSKETRYCGIIFERLVFALSAAKSSSAFNRAREYFVGLPALLALDECGFHGVSVPRLRTQNNSETQYVYDIQVEHDESFKLPVGLIAHNCPLCQTVSRRSRFVPLGQNFAVIGDDPDYSDIDAPPLHPNCMCTLVEVLDTDEQPDFADTLDNPEPEVEDYPEGEAPDDLVDEESATDEADEAVDTLPEDSSTPTDESEGEAPQDVGEGDGLQPDLELAVTQEPSDWPAHWDWPLKPSGSEPEGWQDTWPWPITENTPKPDNWPATWPWPPTME